MGYQTFKKIGTTTEQHARLEAILGRIKDLQEHRKQRMLPKDTLLAAFDWACERAEDRLQQIEVEVGGNEVPS